MSTPGGNWSGSLGIRRWPSNTQCLLSSLRPGGEPGRALTQAPGPGGAAPRPGGGRRPFPPGITAPTASRGGGGGACAQGPRLGWDKREMHSRPGNGLFPRSSPQTVRTHFTGFRRKRPPSSETTATAITASGAGRPQSRLGDKNASWRRACP